MIRRGGVCRTKTIYNSVMIFVRAHSIIVVNGQIIKAQKEKCLPTENEYRAADTSPTPVLQYFNSIVQLAYKMYVIWDLHRKSGILGMTYFWA